MTAAASNLWKSVVQKQEKDGPTTVQVTAETAAMLDGVKRELGVGKGELVRRLLVWFEKQDRDVQIELIRADGDPTTLLVNTRIAEMAVKGAAEAGTPLTLDEAARLARAAIDRLEQMGQHYKRDLAQRLGSKKK